MVKRLRTLKNLNLFELGKILLLFIIFSGFAFTQTPSVKTPAPKTKPLPKSAPLPKDEEMPETPPSFDEDTPFEKSIEVEEEVAINLCVNEGNVRINGWEREEIRGFVNGGSKVGFRAAPPKKKNGKTASVTVLGFDPKVDRVGSLSNCLFGDEIELDVPIGARISIKGRDAKISVKSVTKITVANNAGDISLSDIKEGINATTFEGDILVEDSWGPIELNNTEGSIMAYNTEPIEVGDSLIAKANSGSVILQSVKHSVINARSISGLVKFQGEIPSDGQYRFENTSGQILLAIPAESSCLLEAIAARNRFSSTGFKFTRFDISKVDSTIQKVSAQMGEGEASISLQNQSGRIVLVKIN